MNLCRRRFLTQAALAAGATLAGSRLQAAGAGSDLAARTAGARERYRRVADFINRAHPALREKILTAAAAAMNGQLLLPGNSLPSDVGTPPRWLAPQHGDEEFLWSLNRMMHWKTLLQAEALTGEARYGDKVRVELDDWITQAVQPPLTHPDGRPNPEIGTNAGPPPWRALETGMRMFDSWPVVFEQVAGAGKFSPVQEVRLRESVAQHGRQLRLLSPLLWPEADHNHYFMEMLGLLAAGAYFPDLSEAGEWTDFAVRDLQRCVQKQFTTDGGHIEACPSYHNICVVLLARFLDLARMAGRELPADVHAMMAASADQTLHSVRPTGAIVPWGDSTRSNQVEAALWIFRATGDLAVLQHLVGIMGDRRVQADCAPHLWDIENPEALFTDMTAKPRLRPLVRRDRGNDQVMARSAWTAEAASVFFSCHSPLVPGSGHQHIDLGGFDFTALGRTLVVDPGVYTYRESPERRTYKSAPWHNVLTVDGRSPFDYVSRWRYTPQQEGSVTAVTQGEGMVQIHSFHRNYEPVICHRSVALLEDRILVVLDAVDGIAAKSTVQIYFHLDATQVTQDADGRRVRADCGGVDLDLFASEGLRSDVLPGRISEAFDVERPSRRVRFIDTGGSGRRVYATVLVPSRPTEKAEPVTGLKALAFERACEFSWAGKSYRIAIWP